MRRAPTRPPKDGRHVFASTLILPLAGFGLQNPPGTLIMS